MSDIQRDRDWDADERERADVRQLIDRALGTEPDLRLRPDAVLGLAQRREKTIRFASLGGVVAAVAAATVGVALLMTEPSGSQAPLGPVGPLVPGAGIERSEKPAPTKWPRTSKPPAPKKQTSQPPPPAPTAPPSSASVPESEPPAGGPTASVPTDGPTAVQPAPDGP